MKENATVKEMDKKIRKAFEDITPNNLGSILAEINTEKGRKKKKE